MKRFCIIFLLYFPMLGYSASPVSPEVQLYRTFGTRGSGYNSLAAGLSIHLSSGYNQPTRYFQILGIYVPEGILSLRDRAAIWHFESPGFGFEMALYDEREISSYLKGGRIALRHLEWKETNEGIFEGPVSADVFHIGWAAGPAMTSMLGIELATVHTPRGSFFEGHLSFGIRYGF